MSRVRSGKYLTASSRGGLDAVPVILADNVDAFFYENRPWLAERDATRRGREAGTRRELHVHAEYPQRHPAVRALLDRVEPVLGTLALRAAVRRHGARQR